MPSQHLPLMTGLSVKAYKVAFAYSLGQELVTFEYYDIENIKLENLYLVDEIQWNKICIF